MKISDITKNANKKTSVRLKALLNLKKIKVSLTLVLWGAFVLVFAAELYALYAYGYKTLVFTLPPDTQSAGAAVRVNFVNYDKVIERLSELRSYQATSTINLLGKDQNTGRPNPFTDPGL